MKESLSTILLSLTLIISAASPLIVGGVIAYLVNIIMSWFERHW